MDRCVTLESLIETHDQPFVVIDKTLKVVAVNRAYERRFGVERANVVGRPCYRVFQCQDKPCWETSQACPHRQILQDLQPYAGVFTHCNAAGESYQVRVKGFPLTESNGQLFIGEVLTPVLEPQQQRPMPQMVGQSPRFMQLVEKLERAAPADIPILLEGETGTGKELAAEFLHAHSRRKKQPMVTVDCTVLGEDLFESELFGHERGAFTGSTGNKRGLFELADGGSLFLDEIGEMPLAMQVKLLRAVESGNFRRVGGTRVQSANVRIICATNRSLVEMVKRGKFRQDLYYRIAVFPVRLPALRERHEDIPVIAASLLEHMTTVVDNKYRLSRGAVVRLMNYDYPGNVRELRNILQLASVLSPNGVIGPEEIQLGGSTPWEDTVKALESVPAKETDGDDMNPLQTVEARYITELLQRHSGRRGAVARAMGMSERTLYRKLKRYGLN